MFNSHRINQSDIYILQRSIEASRFVSDWGKGVGGFFKLWKPINYLYKYVIFYLLFLLLPFSFHILAVYVFLHLSAVWLSASRWLILTEVKWKQGNAFLSTYPFHRLFWPCLFFFLDLERKVFFSLSCRLGVPVSHWCVCTCTHTCFILQANLREPEDVVGSLLSQKVS